MIDKIIEMLIDVDPNDTDKLDEIDCAVFEYAEKVKIISYDASNAVIIKLDTDDVYQYRDFPRYTRSRDAIKSIRPKYGVFLEVSTEARRPDGSIFRHPFCRLVIHKKEIFGHGRTEEIAELVAVIKAISYDRETE